MQNAEMQNSNSRTFRLRRFTQLAPRTENWVLRTEHRPQLPLTTTDVTGDFTRGPKHTTFPSLVHSEGCRLRSDWFVFVSYVSSPFWVDRSPGVHLMLFGTAHQCLSTDKLLYSAGLRKARTKAQVSRRHHRPAKAWAERPAKKPRTAGSDRARFLSLKVLL